MPRERRKKKVIFSSVIVVSLVVIDQLIKSIVEGNLFTSESIPIIKNFLHITYVKNTGILFGLLKGYNSIFIVISIVTIFFIILERKLSTQISLILILTGALGNLIDRLIRGYIVDFIDLRVWPVFNIADMCITIGVTILGVEILRNFLKKECR